MKIKQVFVNFESDYCSAEIDVPGLGVIELKTAFLSDETKEKIRKEAEDAMRLRLIAATNFGKFGRWNDL